jgi:uncharacterized protein (TIGR00251 family)
MGPLIPTPRGTRLTLRIQPRASQDQVVGRHGGSIRIRLTAPPVDGAANDALIRFLADQLRVARGAVALVRGHTGREKTVDVEGLPPEEVARRLGI